MVILRTRNKYDQNVNPVLRHTSLPGASFRPQSKPFYFRYLQIIVLGRQHGLFVACRVVSRVCCEQKGATTAEA